MISMLTPSHEQGSTLGVAQGMSSLARIIGPLFALVLFEKNPAVPYLSCAVLCLVTACVASQWLSLPRPAREPQPAVSRIS